MLSMVHELVETNRENEKVDELVEQSVLVDKVGGSSKDVEKYRRKIECKWSHC